MASVPLAIRRALERMIVPRRLGDAMAGPTQAARGFAIVCSSLVDRDRPQDRGMPERLSGKPVRRTTAFA